LKRGDADGGKEHLTAFLQHPPSGDEAEQWIAHARQTLATMEVASDDGAVQPERD
jgi:hypothetical protein